MPQPRDPKVKLDRLVARLAHGLNVEPDQIRPAALDARRRADLHMILDLRLAEAQALIHGTQGVY
jgi:hypothetical protein